MSPGGFFTDLTPFGRMGTAIAPFLVALGIRVLFGKSRITHALLSLAMTWFAVNVLMAPFSLGLREELLNLGRWLR